MGCRRVALGQITLRPMATPRAGDHRRPIWPVDRVRLRRCWTLDLRDIVLAVAVAVVVRLLLLHPVLGPSKCRIRCLRLLCLRMPIAMAVQPHHTTMTILRSPRAKVVLTPRLNIITTNSNNSIMAASEPRLAIVRALGPADRLQHHHCRRLCPAHEPPIGPPSRRFGV